MSAAAHSASSPHLNQALVRWVREALEVLGGSRWGDALHYRGVAAGELCFEEGFFAAQRAVEGAAGAPPPPRGWRARAARVARRARARVAEAWAARGALAPRPTEVAFLAAEPTHLSQQVPVAARLGARAGFVTLRPHVLRQLAARGVRAVLAPSAWPELAEAAAEGARAAASLADPGVALPPAPARMGSDVLGDVLRAQLPGAYLAVRAAELVLRDLQPRAVVVGNDLTVGGRALVRVARAAGVPSACIMHGTVLDVVHAYHVADRLLVYGDAHRRHLCDHMGIARERVLVTGAPYLDSLPAQSGRPHALLRRHLGARPFVLVAVSNPANLVSMQQHERTIRAVMQLSTRLDADVVVRLHRGDLAAHWQRIAAEVPGQRVRVVTHDAAGFPTSILDWLQGAAVLLTGASTVGLEAMLMQVPVVTMDFTGDYAEVDFIRAGATRHVTDPARLALAVSELCAAPGPARARAQGFLGDYFHALDRGGASRCARALLDLVRGDACAG